jgi:DNA primase catalytic subunit
LETELHGEKIFDYEVLHIDDEDRGEIVRIIKSDRINEEKVDRCLRIARREIPQSSAYRSGLIVKCRKGMIWKDKK